MELTGDDLSAWKPAVRRPDWERLLARLASDGAVMWQVDRLMRLPRDLKRLLEFSDRGLRFGLHARSWGSVGP